VYNGFIYAATNSGIRRAAVTNKKFDRLQAMGNYTGNWSSVQFCADLYAINGAGSVHKFDSVSNTFVGFIVLPQPSVDARSTDNYLIITTRNSVYIYNNQMALVPNKLQSNYE
jgi:hypothetical protein